MADIVNLKGGAYNTPDKVLDDAKKAKLDQLVVLGWYADGDMFIAASHMKKSEILWLLEKCKQALLK